MKRVGTETYSIYGQIEEAAANCMIEKYGLTKIPPEHCPESTQRNAVGQPIRFAIVVPREHIAEFEATCHNLRA